MEIMGSMKEFLLLISQNKQLTELLKTDKDNPRKDKYENNNL